MKKFKSYKYLIKPSKEQKIIIQRIFGCVRFVHNLYIDDIKKGIGLNCSAKDLMTRYKIENSFLNEVDGSALMNRLFQLQEIKDKSRLKHIKKKEEQSYTTSNLTYNRGIYFVAKKYIHIPTAGDIEIVLHRDIPTMCRIVKATITREKTSNYYISILVKYNWEEPLYIIDPYKSIGLDYSSRHFYVDSHGNKNDKSRGYENNQKKISNEIKALQRMKSQSNNYNKQKVKIARIYKKISNQRNDYLHKLSNNLANNYDLVFVEDLNMIEMAHNFKLAKRTYDNSFGLFLNMLKYKLEDRGKQLIKIEKNYPSSKMCNVCGEINEKLTIDNRIWKCESCGTILDRDINAAINIRNEGIRIYNSRRVSG